MLPKELKRSYFAKAAPPTLLPPNLGNLEMRPFTLEEHRTLHEWLAETGWPRGTMDIPMLEGYLVALLVWPVSISSGAWLPPIWGEKAGWRVPDKIGTRETFDKFIDLIVGWLRDLDFRLGDAPASFVPTLLSGERGHRQRRTTGVSWSHGFVLAMQQNEQGLQSRSDAARSAVTSIARHGSLEVAPTRAGASAAVANLTRAIVTLVSERRSRGPLGALQEASVSADLGSAEAARRLLRQRV